MSPRYGAREFSSLRLSTYFTEKDSAIKDRTNLIAQKSYRYKNNFIKVKCTNFVSFSKKFTI